MFSTTGISDDLLTAWAVVCALLQPVLSFWSRDESERIFFPFFTRLVVFPYLLACFFMDLCCVAMEELFRWHNNLAMFGEMFLKIR